jgi:hypothetical protein
MGGAECCGADFQRAPTHQREINAFREALIPGLIRYNEDDSYSRRRAFRDELPPGASGLLAGFIDARILVARADKDGHATVEIAHEALFLPGSVEHTYLDACVTDQQAREAAAREERERRLRDAQRLAQEEAKRAQTESKRAQEAERFAREQAETAIVLERRAWWLGLVALVALMAGIVAAWQWQRTERERTVAEARSQANNALRQFDSGRHIEGLLSAREAGQKLWKVARNKSFADYPTVTPLLALQTILDNICEQNRLEYWRQPNQALVQGNPGASDKECSLFLAGKQIAIRDLSPQQLQQIMGHDSRILAWGCSPDGNYLSI